MNDIVLLTEDLSSKIEDYLINKHKKSVSIQRVSLRDIKLKVSYNVDNKSHISYVNYKDL